MHPLVIAAVWSVVLGFVFWIAFWIYVGVGTNILGSPYFTPLSGFEIFGSVRNTTTSSNFHGEVVAFSLFFVAGSFIAALLLYFAWRLIGFVVYSMHTTFDDVMITYGMCERKDGLAIVTRRSKAGFFALLFAYLLVSHLFVFLSASGALSNILFACCTVLGGTAGGVFCVAMLAFYSPFHPDDVPKSDGKEESIDTDASSETSSLRHRGMPRSRKSRNLQKRGMSAGA